MTAVPLEYYDDFADSYGVGAAITIVIREGDGDADYGSALPPQQEPPMATALISEVEMAVGKNYEYVTEVGEEEAL